MSNRSKIEWCDATWNVVTGCSHSGSRGCDFCWAKSMAKRFWGDRKFSDVRCHPERLDQPLHWRKPRRIFVCSMSDLFHPKVPFQFITRVHDRIDVCQQHTFLILTKRIERAKEYYLDEIGGIFSEIIHLGVSISNNDEMWKAKMLAYIPAAVRYISFEPLLEDVGEIPLTSNREDDNDLEEFGQHIDWVVVGGESGPGARPMHPDWARSIRDQCIAARVPFYFKQWGKYFPDEQFEAERKARPGSIMLPWPVSDGQIEKIGGQIYYRVGKKKAGCILDGREWKQLP